MLGVTIALVLYADDAAIPADSAEDLRLAIEIFESFCNNHHLFISVPKTVLTILTTVWSILTKVLCLWMAS